MVRREPPQFSPASRGSHSLECSGSGSRGGSSGHHASLSQSTTNSDGSRQHRHSRDWSSSHASVGAEVDAHSLCPRGPPRRAAFDSSDADTPLVLSPTAALGHSPHHRSSAAVLLIPVHALAEGSDAWPHHGESRRSSVGPLLQSPRGATSSGALGEFLSQSSTFVDPPLVRTNITSIQSVSGLLPSEHQGSRETSGRSTSCELSVANPPSATTTTSAAAAADATTTVLSQVRFDADVVLRCSGDEGHEALGDDAGGLVWRVWSHPVHAAEAAQLMLQGVRAAELCDDTPRATGVEDDFAPCVRGAVLCSMHRLND